MKLRITPDGDIVFIWNDKLKDLLDLGESEIVRASHVEPTKDGRWAADLSPSNGPTLGPFSTRGEALNAEVQWLEGNNLGRG
jgi:hypothetical protein